MKFHFKGQVKWTREQMEQLIALGAVMGCRDFITLPPTSCFALTALKIGKKAKKKTKKTTKSKRASARLIA